MDASWWQAYISEVKDVFKGRLFTSLDHCYGADQFRNTYRNSGAAAIALAAHAGARKIVLLGYDCQKTYDKAHWHNDHPRGLGNASSIDTWPAIFDRIATDCGHVRIVNCSRETALNAFGRGDLLQELAEKPRRHVIRVDGMCGLGDNIYQRAFVRHLDAEVYVDTPWPELYADLAHVHCIRAETKLRTQVKNITATDHEWSVAPRRAQVMRVGYGNSEFVRGSIIDAMARCFGIGRPTFDLPDFGPSPIKSDRPVAIIRPVTARKEWLNTARNPLPDYVNQAADELRRRGFYVVSVADLKDGEEWLVGDAPSADLVLHKGELNITQLLAAIQHAAVVVGGVGWIVPACIAASTSLYCILGGNLAHNAPKKITNPSMDLSKVGWAWPDKPCRCSVKQHDCNKVINGFDDHFRAWLDGQGLFGSCDKRFGVAA